MLTLLEDLGPIDLDEAQVGILVLLAVAHGGRRRNRLVPGKLVVDANVDGQPRIPRFASLFRMEGRRASSHGGFLGNHVIPVCLSPLLSSLPCPWIHFAKFTGDFHKGNESNIAFAIWCIREIYRQLPNHFTLLGLVEMC